MYILPNSYVNRFGINFATDTIDIYESVIPQNHPFRRTQCFDSIIWMMLYIEYSLFSGSTVNYYELFFFIFCIALVKRLRVQ